MVGERKAGLPKRAAAAANRALPKSADTSRAPSANRAVAKSATADKARPQTADKGS